MINKIWYAKRGIIKNGRSSTLYMHYMITGEKYSDHINGNGLDNRRSNLREATIGQNNANSIIQKNNTSGFKGVAKGYKNKWIAQISIGGKTKCILSTEDPIAAARAYDCIARIIFGEYARLNFPRTGERRC